MPHSKYDHALHTNQEVANFASLGDARGDAWLRMHAEDLERARERLQRWSSSDAEVSEPQVP